jgi:hypothetical protein
MRWMVTLLWFLTAFVAGAGLYAASRPLPVLRALMVQLKDGPHCREACAKPASSVPRLPPPPADMDRA